MPSGTSRQPQLYSVLLGAAAIAVVFVAKSIASIGFRWWLLDPTAQVRELRSATLMARYLSAPYSATGAGGRGGVLFELAR